MIQQAQPPYFLCSLLKQHGPPEYPRVQRCPAPKRRNAPPQANGSSSRTKKGLISRVYQDAATRRRTRGMGNTTTRTPKYRADQAKRRADSQPRSSSVKFNVSPGISVSAIDENAIASSTQPPKAIPISFPKELNRPLWKDIDLAPLHSIEPDLAGMELPFILDSVAGISDEYVELSFTSFCIRINCFLIDCTGHCTPSKCSQQETFFPVPSQCTPQTQIVPSPHTCSPYLAAERHHLSPMALPGPAKLPCTQSTLSSLMANCANLPAPPETLPQPSPTAPGVKEAEFTLPIWPLCLPRRWSTRSSRATCTTRTASSCSRTSSPRPRPRTSCATPRSARCTRTSSRRRYTVQALIRNIITLHGLYQNACALGIYDDVLWDTMDVMWRVLLTALAVATGDAGQMLTMRPTAQAS